MALKLGILACTLLFSMMALPSRTGTAMDRAADASGRMLGMSAAGGHSRASAAHSRGRSPAPCRFRVQDDSPLDLLPGPLFSDDEDDESDGLIHALTGLAFTAVGFDRAISQPLARPPAPLAAGPRGGRIPLRC